MLLCELKEDNEGTAAGVFFGFPFGSPTIGATGNTAANLSDYTFSFDGTVVDPTDRAFAAERSLPLSVA